MEKDHLRTTFTTEIAGNIPRTSTFTAEFIKEALKEDRLFYIPNNQMKIQLLTEWLIYSNSNVIVSKITKDLRKKMLIDQEIQGEIEDLKSGIWHSNYFITFNEFLDNFNDIKNIKGRYAVIFEGINTLEEMNLITSSIIFKTAILSIFITDNPTLFINYLENPSSFFSCYTTERFLIRPAYRAMFQDAEIYYYNINDFNIKEYINNEKDLEIANFYIKKGLFHKCLFQKYNISTNLISEKIQCLLTVIEKIKENDILIYFDNDIDELTVHSVLLGGNCRVEEGRFTLNNNKTQLTIQSAREIPTFCPKSTKIILFNFCYVFTDCSKIFIIEESTKSNIINVILDDSNIPKLYKKNDNKNLVSGTSVNNWSYKYEILLGTYENIKNSCRNKDFILNVENKDSKIFISARCTIGRIPTCFNIHNIVKEPILIPKLMCNRHSLMLFSDSIEFCTITSFKTVCNSKIISNNGFIIILTKKIIVYSFTSERNLMIEIDSDDIEDYILLSTRKTQNKGSVIRTLNFNKKDLMGEEEIKTAEEEYLNVTETTGICKEYITISFCLKNRPKIFTADQSDELALKLSNFSDISDKTAYFSTLEWKRACVSNFKDHEDRFDLRVSVPCFQDLPDEVIDNFIYSAREINSKIKEEGQRNEQLAILMKNSLMEAISKSLYRYPAQMVATDLSRMTTSISLASILERFYDFEFGSFYSVACLVSRKGRFLLSKVTNADLEFIASQNLSKYCELLDKSLNTRFKPINFYIEIPFANNIKSNKNKNTVFIRTAVLKPLGTIFNYEIEMESNRVLRNFDPDKFCRVIIREENGRDMFYSDLTRNTDSVYDYFRNVMLNGLVVGLRKYFFLVMTTSQMKIHGSWFITPYEHNEVMIGADYIKSWIGSFQKIKNIGKYAIRIGLALSTTIPTYQFEDFVEIADIEKNSYCFTDGIGLISVKNANYISSLLGLDGIPSAFQIRFGGYKGVVAVHPWLDDTRIYEKWQLENPHLIKGHGKYNNNNLSDNNNLNNNLNSGTNLSNNDNINSNNNNLNNNQPPELILRKSMNKFDSSHNTLEIITFSKSSAFYLNRQIIIVLEGLGVSSQSFIDLQDKYILNTLLKLNQDFPTAIKNTSVISFNTTTDLTFYRKLQAPIVSNILNELNTKSKILIGQGRGAMGVLDELGILEEDQIFCMFQKTENENMENLKDYGSYIVPNCHVLVAKNPVMHPGDIRMVKCVDVPQLHYLKNVVVFSKKGHRPIFNQCSGSDLDGDIFLVLWCRNLMPKATFRPYNYTDTCALVKDKVLLSDIVNFYVRHMKFYQLGQIAISYMAISDKYSIFNEKTLKLCDIFNKNIDCVKTGHISSIPEDLIPTEYPDFMERSPSYYSNKALGHLYRRSSFDLSDINFCECYKCSIKEIQEQEKWKSLILMGCGIKTREIITASNFTAEYISIYENYVSDIRVWMDKTQTKSEEELFCHKFDDNVYGRAELKNLIAKYKDLLKNKEASKMAKVCECKPFNGILALCGDSYKIKEIIKKGIIRNGTSPFIFNSKIFLSFFDEIPKNSLIFNNFDDFYQNRFDCDNLIVHCSKEKYEKLAKMLDFKRKDIFRDLFNLIILSGLFNINQLDQILDLFIRFNVSMKESTVQDLLRVAIPGSDNILFKILCLMSLDLSIIKKATLLRDKSLLRINEKYKISKICKRFCLIISGMLDENDDIEFVKKEDKIIPILKNKGSCGLDYYKEMTRDFLINILYSNENLKFLQKLSGDNIRNDVTQTKKWKSISNSAIDKPITKEFDSNIENLMNSSNMKRIKENENSPLALYEICFTPGEFYFTQIPETHLNDRFSVRSIERMLSSKSTAGNLPYTFINTHDAMNFDKRAEFLAKIKKMSRKEDKDVLSFIYKDNRFDIEVLNGVVYRITKNKKIMGNTFIINGDEKSDLHVELFRKEIIYYSTVDRLEEDEMFMKDPIFELKEDNYASLTYRLIFDQKKYNCYKIKLEKNVEFSNEDGFSIIHKRLFVGEGELLSFKAEKQCCVVSKDFSIGSVEGFNFDKIFGKLWKMYTNIL